MEKIIKLLKESPAIYLASTSENGRPHVRPVSLMLENDGRLYFCTSNETSIFADLQNCPYVEISVMSAEYTWVRISAKAIFTNDSHIKQLAFKNNERIKTLFNTIDNPKFNVFYLSEGKATLSDYSGNPPQSIAFR